MIVPGMFVETVSVGFVQEFVANMCEVSVFGVFATCW